MAIARGGEAIICWCLERIHEPDAITREAVQRDDELEGMLHKLLRLKEPTRSKAIREFWRRYQLAKDFTNAIRQALGKEASTSSATLRNSEGKQASISMGA